MMLEEANKRLRTCQISEEQLWDLNSLYLLLDLNKDDFCTIVDKIGVVKLIDKKSHYDKVMEAIEEHEAKERYIKARKRMRQLERDRQEMECEMIALEGYIIKYEDNIRNEAK